MRLAARAPFAGAALLDFLRARAIPGVERVGASSYERVVCSRSGHSVLRVDVHEEHVETSGEPERVRALFDLDADATAIGARLSKDARLRALVKRHPGLRVPGAFDGFELAVRTVLGQQVSVRAATTLCARFIERFGARLNVSSFDDARAFPSPSELARTSGEHVAAIGLPRSRADTLVAIARAIDEGRVRLELGGDVAATIAALTSVKGIGPWTAKYLAMRALGARDVFLEEDLVVRRVLKLDSMRDAAARATRWSPWRSYAVMHLWRSAADQERIRAEPR